MCPAFSFNRPLETVQRPFWWLTGEIRSKGGGFMVVVGFQRVAETAFFYKFEALLSIETHFQCCVIEEHNGAHLIQTAQDHFFITLKLFSPFTTKQVMFQRDITLYSELRAIINLHLKGM
ncbi:hypothetical protein XENORESO_020544 [Xenotaenia resolanae]|uniref:Uncharacterized protein n=1 Tax=Xenotaenia resolanae TaxID=208358 RepID=A0ABV0W2S5_9TELE